MLGSGVARDSFKMMRYGTYRYQDGWQMDLNLTGSDIRSKFGALNFKCSTSDLNLDLFYLMSILFIPSIPKGQGLPLKMIIIRSPPQT